MDKSTVITLLILATLGISWTIVYLLIIYRSFKDKMCGMPAIVLAFNMFWEFLYSFVFLNQGQEIQIWVNRVWFFFDVVIFTSFILYGARAWQETNRRFFIPFVLFTLISAFSFLYLMQLDFGEKAITYSAFLINVFMSASFIDLLLKQQDLRGQSFGIAFLKMTGTLAATIVLFQRYSYFLQLLGVLCFVLDMIYIVMIVDRYKKLNLHLITRRLKN
ncbi:transmembrane-type terpene cyclase [Lacibacter sediminis]|uniref:Uncharacterized protein n=1 Tax=Lacibacter sediminis TaxID=2760713 RepID=A0A7G5XM49_9BACT|nr:hypothetical protein [Lacibacter sediminis]QNA46552.1 hypothetical protein H4075_10385 [Lacibacter sediminis]